MDGVIVNSENHYVKAEKEFLKRLGIETDDEVLKSFMGVPFSTYFPIIAKKYGSNKSLEEAKQEYHEFIQDMYSENVELNTGVKELFETLSQKYKFALATSSTKKLADVVLERFGLLNFFQARVHGDEVKNGKPDPEIFLKAAELLDVTPEESVIIEDSLNGVKGAKVAGIKVIAFKSDHNQSFDFSNANFIINDLREIPKILEELKWKK